MKSKLSLSCLFLLICLVINCEVFGQKPQPIREENCPVEFVGFGMKVKAVSKPCIFQVLEDEFEIRTDNQGTKLKVLLAVADGNPFILGSKCDWVMPSGDEVKARMRLDALLKQVRFELLELPDEIRYGYHELELPLILIHKESIQYKIRPYTAKTQFVRTK